MAVARNGPVTAFSMFKYAHGSTKLGTSLALYFLFHCSITLINKKEVQHFPFLLVPKLRQLPLTTVSHKAHEVCAYEILGSASGRDEFQNVTLIAVVLRM